VITGCAHAGVVNTAKHAVDLLAGAVPLHAVMGGFHLGADDHEHIRTTVADLKALRPAVLLPGHCSGWRAKFEIERQMPERLVPCTVGAKYTF
jgi:7,8-dihydropterin-6-yl-methyl-4-(beta-D-ribofuranosyl)aminobenzene 5'-phosphate synthase